MDTPQRAAGLIYGSSAHYLDHLGPLCAALEIPLIVTDEAIARQAVHYYPRLQVIHWEALIVTERLVLSFEVIFYCTPRDLFEEIFFFAEQMLQKKIHTIWCPHGNSDKGASLFYMEALRKEKAALVYGKQLIDFLQNKGSWDSLKGHAITGNYRYEFFRENQPFYETIARVEIQRKLPQAKKTLLYAPTWKDYENSCSFFDAIEPLIELLPAEHNLIVKLHPNLEIQEDLQLAELIERYENHPRVLFLKQFPPIYALLHLVDVYIGDMSSIGYDFLTFDKPLFFLNQHERSLEDRGLYLFRCGVTIEKKDYPRIHEIISHFFQFELRDFSTLRKEVYQYTFGHRRPLSQLKREIPCLYEVFENSDLNFF